MRMLAPIVALALVGCASGEHNTSVKSMTCLGWCLSVGTEHSRKDIIVKEIEKVEPTEKAKP